MPSKVTIEPMPGTAPKQLTFGDLKYGDYFFFNHSKGALFLEAVGMAICLDDGTSSNCFNDCPVTRVDVHITWQESEDQS